MKYRGRKDLSGLVLNGVTVIGDCPNDIKKKITIRRLLVRCYCGTEKSVCAGKFVSGNVKSCGCIRESKKLLLGQSARNHVINGYRLRARGKGLPFEFSDNRFFELTAMNCVYCGSAPSCRRAQHNMNGDFVYNTLDRVDSKLGYTEENCVPCCAVCNRAKLIMSKSDFVAWIERLVEFHTK